jgi:hypothetical protein
MLIKNKDNGGQRELTGGQRQLSGNQMRTSRARARIMEDRGNLVEGTDSFQVNKRGPIDKDLGEWSTERTHKEYRDNFQAIKRGQGLEKHG